MAIVDQQTRALNDIVALLPVLCNNPGNEAAMIEDICAYVGLITNGDAVAKRMLHGCPNCGGIEGCPDCDIDCARTHLHNYYNLPL